MCDESDLVSYEQKWMDLLHPEYNINSIAGNIIPNSARTAESVEKMRNSLTGRKINLSPERRKKLVEGFSGDNNPSRKKLFSPERRSMMSKIMSGDKNPNFGKPRSEEVKEKIRKSNCKKLYNGIVSPDGIVYDGINNMSEFCRNHGLIVTNMIAVINGRNKSHKGWHKLSSG